MRIKAFLEHLRERGYAESTISVSRGWLRHFEARCSVPLKKLRPKHISLYHQQLHWEPGPSGKLYSQNTVNQAVGVLKAYFRWCVERGDIAQCPAAHLITRRPPAASKVSLTGPQTRAVLQLPDLTKALGLRDRAILALILEHQVSPRALARLDLTHFQPDTGALLVRGRTRRVVSLGSGAQVDLERYLRLARSGVTPSEETAFFVSRFGRRLEHQSVARVLNVYCLRAGVPRPSYIL